MPSSDVKERLAEDVALWQADGIIDEATRKQLQARYDTPGFGLITAVKYLGIAGGMLAAFGILGFIAAISSSEAFGSVMLAGVSGFLAWAGIKLGRDVQARYVHTSKIILTLGVIGWGSAVAVATHAMHLKDSSMAFVVGLGVVPLTFVISYRERNPFLLTLCTLAFFHWVGSWHRMLGRGDYEFEIDEPRIMAVVAMAVFAFGVWHERRPGRFHVVYQTVALIYFNLSLLILSIYPRSTTAIYISVFTLAALGQIVLAARLKNSLLMGFGVTALALDLFTRYFERMWDHVDQGLFFVIGGVLLMAFGAAFERSYRVWVKK